MTASKELISFITADRDRILKSSSLKPEAKRYLVGQRSRFIKAIEDLEKKGIRTAEAGAQIPRARSERAQPACSKCNGSGQMLDPRSGRLLTKEYRTFCTCPNGRQGEAIYTELMQG